MNQDYITATGQLHSYKWFCSFCNKIVDVEVKSVIRSPELHIEYSCPECGHVFSVGYERG